MFGCDILFHITSEHPVTKYVIVRLARSSSLCSRPQVRDRSISHKQSKNRWISYFCVGWAVAAPKIQIDHYSNQINKTSYYSQNICHNFSPLILNQWRKILKNKRRIPSSVSSVIATKIKWNITVSHFWGILKVNLHRRSGRLRTFGGHFNALPWFVLRSGASASSGLCMFICTKL